MLSRPLPFHDPFGPVAEFVHETREDPRLSSIDAHLSWPEDTMSPGLLVLRLQGTCLGIFVVQHRAVGNDRMVAANVQTNVGLRRRRLDDRRLAQCGLLNPGLGQVKKHKWHDIENIIEQAAIADDIVIEGSPGGVAGPRRGEQASRDAGSGMFGNF